MLKGPQKCQKIKNRDSKSRETCGYVISRILVYVLFIIIIIIIILHELGLNISATSSSNSVLKGLSSRLRPFGLNFGIIFGIILLFLLVICRSQFDLCLLGFSSTGTTFNSFKFF
jgi:hypothetical protein